MLPETVIRLAQIDNIVGVKEATGELQRVAEIRAGCGENFVIISGDDATARELMLAGGNGVISVTANLAPALMSQMCAAALAGESEVAQEIDQRLEGLHNDLFLEANPIPVKWALAEMGRIGSGIRLPLTRFSQEYHDSVRNSMRLAGII
jgi:4-hydroxy-tetrahydrodipicolinate synthase